MKNIFTKLALVLLIIIQSQTLRASHLMGGNLGYTYIGLQPNGSYRYTVKLELYRFCGTATPSPSPLPANMKLGVYNEDPANPNADKVLQLSTTAPLIFQQFIDPPNANDTCTFTPNACVEQGIYEITIDLPASPNGYHLLMDRCCRNGNIQNVFDPSNEGEAWYAFIPPTSVINNSPTFAVPPVPFICAADTVSVLNSAFDADGDLLIYHFTTPLAGISDGTNSNPNFPATYTWPIPQITYAAGYSFAQPFGPGGYADIDTLTGLTTYLAPNQGYYVVAVEVREYRNGFLVGISRLDFQLILITCPINPAPIPAAGGSTTLSVQEGQTLCFNITYNDPNGDSLTTTHTGTIFGPPTNPAATLSDVTGDSTVTTQFCWTTSCSQGQSIPYQFTISCSDNGCPAKTINQVYTIFVIPFNGVNSIQGPDTLCSNGLTGLVFTAAGTVGSTYNWTVNNGTQVSGGNTGTITVNFNPTGPWSVSVTEVNAIGCAGNTVTKNIYVKQQPTVNAGVDHTFCSGGSAQLGTTTTAGYLYSWAPATGLSSSSVSNPTVTLTNGGATPTTNTYILTTDLNGCTNKDTVVITVNPTPLSNAGNNQFLCSGSSTTIGTISTSGYTYSWSPSSGLSSSTVSNPTVTWTTSGGQPDTLNYTVTTTNSYLCTSTDNVQIIVNVLPTVTATSSPVSICPGASATLTATGANLYSWALLTTPGTPIGTSNPFVVNPTVTTSYIVTGTNSLNCVNKDTITVTVLAAPAITATQNTDSICPLDSVVLSASGGLSYTWTTQASPTTIISSNSSLTVTPSTTTSYIVTGTGANGCTNKDTITVNVNPAPLSNAGNNQSLCSTSSITLGTLSTSGYTYSWSPSTGLSSTSISNPTLTLSNGTSTPDTSVYTVITTNQFGCTSSDDVTIITNPVPNAVAGPDVSYCSGQTVQLGGPSVPGYSYLWNPSAGLLGPTTSNPIATLTNTGTANDTVQFVVTATWFGCIDRDTVVVIIKPLPLSNAGTDQTICSGDTVQLGTASTAGYTYSWTPGSGLSNTSISDPTAILNASTTTTVTYYVSTTLNGCTSQDSVAITINPLPAVSAVANPTSICLGSSATLTASGASSYSWALLSNPGSVISTSNPFTVNPSVTTSFIVTGTSIALCVNYDTITINVNPLPNVTATAPNDSICFGDSIILSSNGASTYSWQILGGSVIGSGNSITVNPTVTTSYVVTGTDGNGCENKDTLTITVNPAPTLNSATGTLSVCPGVTGVPYWVNNPDPNSTYSWTVTGGTIASGQGQDTVYIDWGVQGTGTVTVTEATEFGCISPPVTITVSINVILTPQAPTGTPVICANDAQGLTYTVINTPGSVYTWHILGGTIVSGNSTSSVVVDWTQTGPATGYLWYDEQSTTVDTVCFGVSDTFQVTINPAPVTSAIQGPPQLCVSDSTNLSVTSTTGSTYQWYATGGSINSGQGSNQIGINWTTAGNYTVAVVETNTYGCVGDSVFFNIVINPLPVANAGSNVAICTGQSTNLLATGGTIYSWSPSTGLSDTSIPNPIANPTSTTTYVVTVTDANGCSNTDDVIVTVNSLPVVVTSANPAAICIGQNTQLQASGGSVYAWIPATDLNDPSIAAPTATPTTTTTYTVTVTDNNLCSSTASITVTVNPLPIVTVSNDTLICDGSSVTLQAGGASTYLWTPSTGLNSSSVDAPVASPNSTTVYTVTGTDGNGCTNTDVVTVNVNEQPVAAFTDTALASCQGINVQFTDASIDADSYFWNFGGGATSTDQNPVHFYNFGADANVTLIVGNGGICYDTLTVPLDLLDLSDYLKNTPNVFTPNNDGKNDCFSLNGLGDFKECTTIKIFDRWGKEVFSSSNSESCWDGKNKNGDEVPNGTFFYIIDISGKQLNGTVLLIR